MCLILLAWRCHPGYRLILAANRDEFLHRPTAPLAFWPEHPEILAGRDLQAGGTWFGLTGDCRFAAVTNYRDPATFSATALSRGQLPVKYLMSRISPQQFCTTNAHQWPQYNGFNLLAGDADSLIYTSNRSPTAAYAVAPGIHGLSNHLLDTPWPKVARGMAALHRLLDGRAVVEPDDLFPLLEDSRQPPDDELPETGVSLEWERLLATALISGSEYGTRSSLALIMRDDGTISCAERTFAHAPTGVRETGKVRFDLHCRSHEDHYNLGPDRR
jgi:uncharacterized protein with NRDE domain